MSQYKMEWVTDQLAAGYATLSYEDLAFVKEKGITAIVNLYGEFCDLCEIQKKQGFKVLYVPILDECALDLATLEKVIKWVEEKIEEEKKILVHCRFGVGRTGMIVFAYLLRRGMGLKAITRKLKNHRVNPSAYCHWKLLRQYEKSLKNIAVTGKVSNAD